MQQTSYTLVLSIGINNMSEKCKS